MILMDAMTPEEARAYFKRWELVRDVEAAELTRATMETKLQQLAALTASRSTSSLTRWQRANAAAGERSVLTPGVIWSSGDQNL